MPLFRHARSRATGASVSLVLLLAVACSAPPPRASGPTRETRERAYRANNTGVALLEQLKYPEAAAAFRQALTVDPSLGIAHLNLSLALMYDQNLDEALKEASAAADRMPEAPQPAYVQGLVARAQNRNAEARTFFEKVRGIDSTDIGTNVNLAQIALEDRRYDDAVMALQPIVGREPYHVTASYVLGLALTRSGRTDEGQVLLNRAQELRSASYAVTFGTGYLEQGRYAEAIASTGAEPELVDPSVPPATFSRADITPSAASPVPTSAFGRTIAPADLTEAGVRQLVVGLGGGQTLVDVDGDGTLELVVVSADSQRILRPAPNGSATDITTTAGFTTASRSPGIGVVAADVDNDGAPDLFVLRASGSSLYRNDGKGRFTDVTRTARIPPFPGLPGTAAFVDVDHDGDVDLVIGGLADIAATRRQRGGAAVEFPSGFQPASLQLLRNNGNGTFTDATRAAKLDRPGHTIAIVPTDFDNHRDIDLLIVDADGTPALLSNQRDGTFRDVSGEVGLAGPTRPDERTTAVATGDVNKDDYPDFFFARTGASVLALSDGHGNFRLSAAPEQARAASAAQLVDYDNDGILDLVAQTANGLTVLRNVGPGFIDVSAAAVTSPGSVDGPVRSLSIADVERDGDLDIVSSSGEHASLWRNSGDPRNHALRIQLRGRVTNRQGFGSKVQIRAGSLSARAETSSAMPAVAAQDLVFGLGTRPGADVTRVLWPSGILQAETAPASQGTESAFLPTPFLVEELDRKPSSCPFLFVWNGERFEFVTDFLGGGEMGYWEGPGAWNRPDPVEYVRIRGDQLVPVNGRLQLRVTNELEEVLYVDQLQLMTIAHPADVQVYPNEGMTVEAKPHRLHGVRTPHTPARVTDEHGHDVTERIARLDRRYPDDFAKSPVRGYADLHDLIIDLGAPKAPQTLLLTAWTDYAFSSDNVAAQQGALPAVEPYLEARDARGTWRRLDVAIGIPVGRPQTIPLDLSHALRPGEHELRLRTTMRIYWDQIQVGDTVAADGYAVKTADPRSATLRERGFSAEVRPDGQDPPGYDYARVSQDSPWKAFTGSFTRVGDVLSLLTNADDHFVIAKTGDEVALEFDATTDAVPPGWTRTYLLRGDGYSKEMDVNSASPDTVEPLPFHGMSRYPYPATERYPDTPAHQAYRDQFNTRRVMRAIPKL